jgi:hypothetical protein
MDFKTEECGHILIMHQTLGKRERTIVYSLFMRSLIENSQVSNKHVIHLREQLRHLEGQYWRKNKQKYEGLVKISQKAYRNALIVHNNTHIDPFMVVNELFLDAKNVFTGNFKLKSSIFERIMTEYEGKNPENETENALKVVETLKKEADMALNNV